MSSRFFLACAILAPLQSSVDAFVTHFSLFPVDQNLIPGFYTIDVYVTGTDELIGGTGEMDRLQMHFELFNGSIYQDPLGTMLPPTFTEPFTTTAFDTFVGIGAHFAEFASPTDIQGGAVGLGGNTEVTFDESTLDIAWAPVTPVYAPSDLFIARITVSDDAAGTMSLLGSTLGEPELFVERTIGFHEDPLLFVSPPENTIISLDAAIESSGGVLTDAITLSLGFSSFEVVTDVSLADGSLFAFEDVLGQEMSFDFESGMSNDVLVDIAFTGFSGHGLLPGTVVSDELTIETTGGAFHFTLAATIPMPDLTGDYNGNGMVEQGDLDLVLLHWGDDASEVSDDWINNFPSGAVDQQELDAVLLGWGTSVDAVGGVGIPEPASGVLLAILVAGIVVRQRSCSC